MTDEIIITRPVATERPIELMSDWTSTTNLRPHIDEVEQHLPDGWYLVRVGEHDQPVAIGPGGAYALVVRRRDGAPITLYDRALFVRNRRTDALRSAAARADRAAADLERLIGQPIACHAVVVISGDELTVRSRPENVHVLHDHLLNRWLSRLPRAFDDDRVRHIVRVAG